MKIKRTRLLLSAILFAVTAIIGAAANAGPAPDQALRQSLFGNADQALADAREAQADVLAPTAFEDGLDRFQDAERQLARGRSIDDIRDDLARAVTYFRQAIKSANLARVNFATLLKARGDAQTASASTLAAKEWTNAERLFRSAAERLEGGSVSRAKRPAQDAEAAYRSAELTAIETSILADARSAVAEAERNDVDDYAPQTLARAQMLLRSATDSLRRSRYETSQPREVARDAAYQARHALLLAGIARKIDRRESTVEALLLQHEAALTKIGDNLGLRGQYDRPTDEHALAIVRSINALQDESSELALNLRRLETERGQLSARLGGETEARAALAAKLQREEDTRARLLNIENMFSADEARVLREGNSITLRLLGLNFRSGASTIDPSAYQMLQKVRDAVAVFPSSRVVIEGHTDSVGNDTTNLTLSQERADAVLEYLRVNSNVRQIGAYGYGESKPIASNDSTTGRAQNRRIDVIITPTMVDVQGR